MPDRPLSAGQAGFLQDEVFWRGLFDIHLDPLAFIDADYRILRANLALANALGCRQEDLAGRTCYELFHGSACPAPFCPHSRLLSDGCEHACEAFLDRLGGSFWISVTPVFDNTGMLVGCLHIARNVTAYKTLEGELRTAQKEVEERAEERALELKEHLRFEQVLVSLALNLGRALADAELRAHIQQGVSDIGAAGRFGRCVFWKVTGGTAFELGRFEDAGHALPEQARELTSVAAPWLFAEPNGSCCMVTDDADVERCAATMRPLWSGDAGYALVAERRVSFSKARMALSSERLSLFCHIMGDAVRRQAGAQESRRLREEMANLDRMARLGQLSATLAHELNQPLAATLCNAQAASRLLRQPEPDLGEACSALDDIVSSARHAGEVMRHTRALFKGEDQVYHPVDLQTLVPAVLKLLSEEIALAGAIIVRQDSPVPLVQGNVVQLQQVLINLIKNALDAVCLTAAENRKVIVETGRDGQGAAVLSVKDSGPGLAAGEEEKVFQPFYSRKAEGMGMGLPICRQIIKHHGGVIAAKRMPEGGACFTVTLPTPHAPGAGA